MAGYNLNKAIKQVEPGPDEDLADFNPYPGTKKLDEGVPGVIRPRKEGREPYFDVSEFGPIAENTLPLSRREE